MADQKIWYEDELNRRKAYRELLKDDECFDYDLPMGFHKYKKEHELRKEIFKKEGELDDLEKVVNNCNKFKSLNIGQSFWITKWGIRKMDGIQVIKVPSGFLYFCGEEDSSMCFGGDDYPAINRNIADATVKIKTLQASVKSLKEALANIAHGGTHE